MLKVLKIRSVENAIYTTQQNRMRFRIPSDNLNTHLMDSYLSFQVELVDPVGVAPPAKVNIGFGDADTLYYSTCLLKTVRLFRGDSNIPLEEIQNFNMLDQNLKYYEKDTENLATDQFTSGFLFDSVYQGKFSPFYWTGSSDIQIPLKYIFGLCKNKDFYLSNTDGLQMEFELEDRFKIFNKEVVEDTTDVIDTSPVDDATITTDDGDTISNYSPNNAGAQNPSGTGTTAQNATSKSTSKTKEFALTNNLYYIGVNSQDISGVRNAGGWWSIDVSCNTTKTIVNGITLNGVFSTAESNSINASGYANMIAYLAVVGTDPKVSPTLYPVDIDTFTGVTMSGATVSVPAKFRVKLPGQAGLNATLPTFNALAYINKRRVATDLITIPLTIPNAVGGAIPATWTKFDADKSVFSNESNYLGTGTDTPYVKFTTSGNSILMDISQNAIGAGNSLITDALYEIQVVKYLNSLGNAIPSTSLKSLLLPNSQPDYIEASPKAYVNFGTSITYTLKATSALQLKFTPTRGFSIGDVKEYFHLLSATAFYGNIVLRRVNNPSGTNLTTYEATDYTYKIPRAELVLLQESKKSSDAITKVYATWKMEPSLIETETYLWQKQFILEPNVANSILLTPPSGYVSLYSVKSNINSYRWALDNIDNTNRDVVINNALHNDKLIDLFNNTGLKLKALVDETSYGIIPMKIYTAMDDENVYMDNMSHTLQVVLKSDESATNPVTIPQMNVYLFKQVLKNM